MTITITMNFNFLQCKLSVLIAIACLAGLLFPTTRSSSISTGIAIIIGDARHVRPTVSTTMPNDKLPVVRRTPCQVAKTIAEKLLKLHGGKTRIDSASTVCAA